MHIYRRLRAALTPLFKRVLKPTLTIPDRFNRNSSTVTAFMPPDQAGVWLLERMRQQIRLDTFRDRNILDFGCGVRFTQAIINSRLEIGAYHGVDNFREMIDFLRSNIRDSRFSYSYLDAHHPLYNVHGTPLSSQTNLPVPERSFDIVCMFSVITHQSPDDSHWIFQMLRRYVRENGYLFFTCFVDEEIATFEDRSVEQNGGRCFYNPGFLTQLVTDCGWEQVSYAPADAPLIGDAFVYRPV